MLLLSCFAKYYMILNNKVKKKPANKKLILCVFHTSNLLNGVERIAINQLTTLQSIVISNEK